MSDLYKAISSSIGNKIEYFENLRTGEITVDNGDGTYDVKIANADSAYPNVETLNSNETYGVTEIVIIGFEYGCKESPKILGHDKKIAQEPKIVEVDYSGGARVKTLNAYSITSATAYLNGEISITANIIGNCTRRGFHYGTDTGYGSDEYEDGSFEAGTYTLQIEGLDANTTYHYQAYVIDANGDEQVGEDKTMTTSIFVHRIYVVYDSAGTYYINSYDQDGNYLDKWTIETTENIGNAICVDENENVYTITGDQHSIKKRDLDGILVLTKTETNYIYNIVAGPDGYIYTIDFDSSFDNGYIRKRNASDLTSVGTLRITTSDTYYGLTIDSDGIFYTVNGSDKEYQSWNWDTGLVASWAGEYTFASLATIGDNLANVDWIAHAILTPKDLSGGETDYELTDLDDPATLGSIGNYYLVSGYEATVEIGKYDSSFSKVWTVNVGSGNHGCIAAYPF